MNTELNLNCTNEFESYSPNPYFHVILAGLQGGGRFLTGLRERIGSKGCVLSSLSTRFGLKRGEYRLETHYRNLAADIIKQAQGQIIRIYAHSLGGIEVLDLMRMLSIQPDLPHQALEVIFISPPGIGQKGWGGVREVGKRLVKVVRTLGWYDQYQLLPLANVAESGLAQKRQIFLEEWLPRIIANKDECDQIKQSLQDIDKELNLLGQNPELQQENILWYQHKRHQVMKPLIEKILGGSHILEETHSHYLQRNGEHAGNIFAPRLACVVIGLELAVQTLRRLYQGVDIKIVEAFEACRKAGIDIKIGVVILGRDELVRDQDYTGLLGLALSKRIPIHRHIFESEEHSSVAYNWELIDALEALDWSANIKV